jgi:hypothetical protein
MEAVMKAKKSSALPTGRGTLIEVRFPPAELKGLDRWIRRDGRHETRPAAVRQLVKNALAVAEITSDFARNRSPQAIELAGSKIELLLNRRNC